MSVRRILYIVMVIMTIGSYGECAANSSAGTTADQILEIPNGVRAVGMGGAFCAVADDSDCLSFNPAGLGVMKHTEISLQNDQWFQGMQHQFAGIIYNLHDVRAFNLEDLGCIGLAFTSFDSGDVVGTDALGALTGTFSVKKSVITACYGKPLIDMENVGKITAGFNAKYVEEDLVDDTVKSAAADVGVLWLISGGEYSLGAAVQNMGGDVSYSVEDFKLPLNMKAGVAGRFLNKALILDADVNNPNNSDLYFNVGGEYWAMDTIAFRAGYDSRNTVGSGLTLGFGLSIKQLDIYFIYLHDLEIDYAFVSYGDLGDTNRVGIKLKLGAD